MTVTAIRIQYCTSCTTRTDTAARKGPIRCSSIILHNKHRGNGKAVYEEALTKDVLQEIVYRAQLTTLSLNHPYMTEDRTRPYLARLVKDHVKDYKGNRN